MDLRPTIVYSDSHGIERRHVIAGERLRVGRLAECDLVLSDPLVSRQHCVLERDHKGWSVLDLESRFGTFVNDDRIEGRRDLKPGDRLRVGNTSLTFVEMEASQGEVTIAPMGDGSVVPAKQDAVDTAAVRLTRVLRDANATGAAEMKALVEAVGDATSHLGDRARLELLGRVLGEVLAGLRTPDVDRILAVAVDMAIRGIKADRGYALLREGDSITRVGRDIGDLRGGSTSIGERVAADGVPVLTVDAQNDSRFMQAQSVMLNDVRAVMCVPIPGPGGSPVGALYVDAKQRGLAVNASGLELLTALANHVAMAIEHARRQSIATTGRPGPRNAPRTGIHAIGDLVASGEPAARAVTVLAIELRGERAILDAPPAEAVDLLNDLFTGIHEDVQAEGGALDRYLAAGLTAIWGAARTQEDRAVRAARCALKIRARVAGAEERWRKQGRAHAQAAEKLTCAIGIDDGNALTGNVGSLRRLEMTAVGEVVKRACAFGASAADGEIVLTEQAMQRLGSRVKAEVAKQGFRLLDVVP